ncbi:hypothetical protein E4U60_002001 [Claviceps pazoutovae]|uniref:Uncharacterized protein n=1 Tax=Claviceps pazoutovae TaxID=1649127 RepID=A0A9P7MCE1_9HYPO|nr:hypothetical protein E4U60_002001 [Claviceps pazoutovae]
MLRDDYTFAELATRILRLTRIQIQVFLIEYMAEYRVWMQYEQNVSRIPWAQLIRHAGEKKLSVAELLHVHRPRLPTDEISREGIATATRFLHARGLGTYAAGLDGWFGIGKMDFLDLEVHGAMVRDTLDREAIAKAAEYGWIDVDEVVRRARQRARKLVLKADTKCRVQDVFLGTIKSLVPGSDAQGVDCGRDGIHVTPRCNRTVWSGVLEDIDEAASQALMQQTRADDKRHQSRGIMGHRGNGGHTIVSKAQIEQVFFSLARQVPALLPRHVPGSVVTTAEERVRAAAANMSTSSSSSISISTPTWGLPRRPMTPIKNAQRLKAHDLRKATTSRVWQARVNPLNTDLLVDYSSDSPDACHVLTADDGKGMNASRGRRQTRASQTGKTKRCRTQDVSGDGDGDGNGLVEGPVRCRQRSGPQDVELGPRPCDASASRTIQLPPYQACGTENRVALDKSFSESLGPEDSVRSVKRKRIMSLSHILEAQDDDGTNYHSAKPPATKRKPAPQPQHKTAKRDKGEQAMGGGNLAPRMNSAVAHDDGNHEQTGAEPVKTKKNTAPLFGLPRHQVLCAPLKRAEQADYAWSADVADFAMVCGHAKYALKADRVLRPGQGSESEITDTDTDRYKHTDKSQVTDGDIDKDENAAQLREALHTLMKLHNQYNVVETAQRGCAGQDTGKARFAGCADWALYAADAEVAEYVLDGDEEGAGRAAGVGDDDVMEEMDEGGGMGFTFYM